MRNRAFSSPIRGRDSVLIRGEHYKTLWCGNGGTRCPAGLTCIDQSCVPDGCPASCGALMVCDKDHAVCVEDCRFFGTYCGADEDGSPLLCDQQTGLCR